jgi:hypothetical protein
MVCADRPRGADCPGHPPHSSHKVLLDADLADLYGVTTKRLNEQVKRNPRRFPDDFLFPLDAEEKVHVVAPCDYLQRLNLNSEVEATTTRTTA